VLFTRGYFDIGYYFPLLHISKFIYVRFEFQFTAIGAHHGANG